VKLLRATALALIDDKVPERFARHVRQDIEDADFRRTPGDSVMAARIKKSARNRERANYVDVEGLRCFCMGMVPEFAIDNLKLAQNSDWMAYNNADILSLSDCRPVQHAKSYGPQNRMPRKPLEEILRLIDREDWVWFGRPQLDGHLDLKTPGTLQPGMVIPPGMEGMAAQDAMMQLPGAAAGSEQTSLKKRTAQLVTDVAATASRKLNVIAGHFHLDLVSRLLSAHPQIPFAFVALTAVVLFALEPSAFNEAFPAPTSNYSRLSSVVRGIVPTCSRSAGVWVVSAIMKLLCLTLSGLANAIVWLQQTDLGMAIPADQRILFHQ
jgi:hypothetical protein